MATCWAQVGAVRDRIEDRLPLIEQRTLVVYGQADGFIGRGWAERVAALLPLGHLVVIPAGSRIVHYTQPDVVAQLVRVLAEEREHGRGDLVGRLEHRDVPVLIDRRR